MCEKVTVFPPSSIILGRSGKISDLTHRFLTDFTPQEEGAAVPYTRSNRSLLVLESWGKTPPTGLLLSGPKESAVENPASSPAFWPRLRPRPALTCSEPSGSLQLETPPPGSSRAGGPVYKAHSRTTPPDLSPARDSSPEGATPT